MISLSFKIVTKDAIIPGLLCPSQNYFNSLKEHQNYSVM